MTTFAIDVYREEDGSVVLSGVPRGEIPYLLAACDLVWPGREIGIGHEEKCQTQVGDNVPASAVLDGCTCSTLDVVLPPLGHAGVAVLERLFAAHGYHEIGLDPFSQPECLH